MRCTIVYDNSGGDGLEAGWGFSCLVEAHGKKVLFDTGDDGKALLSNMKKLGIDPQSVDCLFLSHGHMDHCGGIGQFLDVKGSLPVYAPESACPALERVIGGKAQLLPVSGPRELFAGFFTTGELDGIEQSLVVSCDKGNVVVCGCSHPGLENIIERALGFGEVYGVIGGFHGFDKLSALEGIRLIAPCHCTARKSEIEARFPESYAECSAGEVFEV